MFGKRGTLASPGAAAMILLFGAQAALAAPDYEIWVADRGIDAIRVYGSDGSHIRSITSPQLNNPVDVQFGPDGDVFVVCFGSDRVQRFDFETGAFESTYIDDDLEVSEPTGLLFTDKYAYVLNNDYHSISVHDINTGVTTDVMFGGINLPQDMVFGPDGNIYMTNRAQNGYIQVWDPNRGIRISAFGSPKAGAYIVTGITFTPDGDILVCDWSNSRVLRYDGKTYEFLDVFIASGAGGLDGPSDINFAPDGHLIISNWHGGLHRFNGETGAFIDEIVPIGTAGLTEARGFTFRVLPPECPSDLAGEGGDSDGVVNVFDLFALLSNWATAGQGADLAEPLDVVDVFDLFVLLSSWGDC